MPIDPHGWTAPIHRIFAGDCQQGCDDAILVITGPNGIADTDSPSIFGVLAGRLLPRKGIVSEVRPAQPDGPSVLILATSEDNLVDDAARMASAVRSFSSERFRLVLVGANHPFVGNATLLLRFLAELELGLQPGSQWKKDLNPIAPNLRIRVQDAMFGAAEEIRLHALCDGLSLARQMTDAPSNVLNPERFVAWCAPLRDAGICIDVMDEQALIAEGCNGIVAVGRSSECPPRMICLSYRHPTAAASAPIVLVGKGVTFDSGGYFLKPHDDMAMMKGDMAGGAAVVGTLLTIAREKLALNVIGLVPLAENLLSRSAIRPGDILQLHSGASVEIVDTDAEGRLLLADALSYANRRFSPDVIVDIATLTYSIESGLGSPFSGLYTTSVALEDQLIAAGEISGEPLWPMPLGRRYRDNLGSRLADLRQCAAASEGGDSPHAAAFLWSFVENVDWAHLDIAGKEFRSCTSCEERIATGYGVALLSAFCRNLVLIQER
ncbi:leucyl aminopeptidase [Rhizobium sp. PP-F2F-G38]|nr:leucyl aminopeptidase [Rhizobium sp. PP-WC-1G-195]PYE92718.1 leucyl aminopeptidase [Rhizobium sp. PP-F2F-G38]TCL89658.1 leucyl aminopeptidase [Rhizobium sp. PP-WC-2G-219]TCP77239.1 leucyl aminopeptidase [Rhizobium sp. PP-CC-2G-626]TCQ03327.1 leucyl aminopeptidase [Rhizobium sp. PP-F2F-G36]